MEDDRCWWVAHSGLVATDRLQNAGRISALRVDSMNMNENMQLMRFFDKAECLKKTGLINDWQYLNSDNLWPSGPRCEHFT